MKNLTVTTAMAMLVSLVVLAPARPASADEACTGTFGSVSIDDTVVVPQNATCTLDGTNVDGDVKVHRGATLVTDGATIEGNVQTEESGSASVTVRDSEVGGDVQVFEGNAATVIRSQVGGNVQYDDNDADLRVVDSSVDGDVQLFDNRGGDKEVRGNTIGGNLQCKGNDPAPFGGDNTVDGNEEDQCADLQDAPGDGGGGTPPPGGDGSFTDVPSSNVFAADVAALAASGITRGCNPPANDRFCPDDPVTRAQMAAFLVRGLGLAPGSGSFDDVPSGNVFAADVAALAAAGITRGCNPPANDRFCPDDPVSRAQMAAFLVRGLGLAPGSASFDDVPASNVFSADVAALASADITRGCNPPANDRFCPDESVTRAQMAAFLVRAGLTG